MKKIIGATLGVLVVVAPALAIIPTTRDEIHWRWASLKDEPADYESYVKTWPDGRHTPEAQMRYDEHGWANAQAANTVEGYQQYLRLHGEGRHITEAQDCIEALHWQKATDTGTIEGFELYLQRCAEGKHTVEAENHIEAMHWQEATAAGTVEGFECYLQRHGQSRHAAEAGDHIESLHWQKATAADTIKSYQDYCTTFPQGQYAQEANAKIAALRTDNTPFAAAMKTGTVASLERFLEDFPGHQKEAYVRQVFKDLAEDRDLLDLFAEHKIDMVAFGDSIHRARLRIRKLVPYPLTVRIPAGTYLVPGDPAAQSMVVTAEDKVRLVSNEWQSTTLAVACANRPKRIPRKDDYFTVRRSPYQAELIRLMPVLDKAQVGNDTRQAAVWIVTDNADYDDLGTLVASSWGIPGGRARAIGPGDAARAMKICAEAGINITCKAIWKDRQEIIKGLEYVKSQPEYAQLITWLRQQR